MPVLVRFLMRHAAIGFGIAGLFVAVLLALDIYGLRTLMAASSDGWLAAGILTFAMGLTFSSVQMGAAIMLLAQREDRPTGGKRMRLHARPVPVPVEARPAAR
ncbi:hypothetical protein ACLBXM_21865 [Xanthobacteraceae bacterium A53D]